MHRNPIPYEISLKYFAWELLGGVGSRLRQATWRILLCVHNIVDFQQFAVLFLSHRHVEWDLYLFILCIVVFLHRLVLSTCVGRTETV